VHPVEISGALQQPTCALVENAKRCYILSTTAHKLSSTVSCNDCTQLMMLPLNGWRQTAPPGFCNRREWGMGRGSRVWSPPEADTFTAVHREFVGFGICRVIRRSSTTMKAHTYYIIFGHPPIRGEASPPLAAPLINALDNNNIYQSNVKADFNYTQCTCSMHSKISRHFLDSLHHSCTFNFTSFLTMRSTSGHKFSPFHFSGG